MALDFLRQSDCIFTGPALPEPFVQFELERVLRKHDLLPATDGLAGQALQDQWEVFRRKLRDVSPNSGPLAIAGRILDPLAQRLGYKPQLAKSDDVATREGEESGGLLMSADGGASLRCWTIDYDADLDAPTKRGYAYRFSPVRVAQRVLLSKGERVGLLTNGVELRLLLCDPARPDSQIEIKLNEWRKSREMPDGYLLFLALAGPKGIAAIPEIVEQARLQQSRVTKELRVQARLAVEEFAQCVLDHPENTARLAAHADPSALAKKLWHEGLVVVYRLLFILKCESTSDKSRAFRFAGADLWLKTYSPSRALARRVRQVLDNGAQSGRYLEDGLRVLFRVFAEGLNHPGLNIRPLGGALFGAASTPLLSDLRWGEQAVAKLLDRLLWTTPRRGTDGRTRVHYGPLDVEDLGRVYEALLELEPGIAGEPMCRLRRSKLEVVVPAAQGEKYRASVPAAAAQPPADDPDESTNGDEAAEPNEEEETSARGKKTKVEWIEAIPAGRFYLRVGLGRKSSGSYYTPHSFVRFLVQETLGPQCDQRSPRGNPNPGEILKLKVLDPACGSGHFLVEACRFLGVRLYEAARLCDELAAKAEADAEQEKDAKKKAELLARAADFRKRNQDLPDPEDELLAYLPSRSAVAGLTIASSYSSGRAEAICRRLVAVHCLYGVDLNPLAVELAKLSLWIESHAEGLPLTFLDHRIVVGNSLTGPFWEKLIWAPGSKEPVPKLFYEGLAENLTRRLTDALGLVRELELSVGVDAADIARKDELKRELDANLTPFRILAAAWSGGVMIDLDVPDSEPRCDDEAYAALLKHVGSTGELPDRIEDLNLQAMIIKGLGLPADTPALTTRDELAATLASGRCRPALPYDLAFPEVSFPTGLPQSRSGFDVVLGNPPWNKLNLEMPAFMGSFDFRFIEAETGSARGKLCEEYADTVAWAAWETASKQEDDELRLVMTLHAELSSEGGFGQGNIDIFAPFVARAKVWLKRNGEFGMMLPSGLHVSQSLTLLRRSLLREWTVLSYFCFENTHKLFDIHGSWKYTPVLLRNSPPSGSQRFSAQFYLHDDAWLFAAERQPSPFWYPAEVIERMDPKNLVFQEFTDPGDIPVCETMFLSSHPFGEFCENCSIDLRRELHATDDRWRIDYDQTPLTWAECAASGLVHHKPGTIHQFTDLWRGAKTALVCYGKLADKGVVLLLARFYRAAYRVQARATDERTSIFAILPPGTTATNSVSLEGSPDQRPNSVALATVATCNSYCFDWGLRLRVGSKTVSKFLMEGVPFAGEVSRRSVIAHAALRLGSNHAGYEPLWREQLGEAWREDGKTPFTWPVLAGDDERWAVRAVIDAVVADAYGLSRDQYEHVLSTFSHSSYRTAPALCLAAFDELKKIGLEAFCRKHDPYWDIPLNESLPQPVIDLPIPDGAEGGLFREKSGQVTLLEPGPLYEGVKAVEPGSAPADTKPRRSRRGRQKQAAVDPTKGVPELNRAVAALVIGLVGFEPDKTAGLYQTATRCAMKPREIGKALDKREQTSLKKHLQGFCTLVGKLPTAPVDWDHVRTSLINLGAIEVSGDAPHETWACGDKHRLLLSHFGTVPTDLAGLLMKAAKNVHDLRQGMFGRESVKEQQHSGTKTRRGRE